MKSPFRTLAILAVGAAVLSGGARPRPALAVDGAIQFPGNGHWYKIYSSTTKLVWGDCKTAAQSIGGYLGTITTAEEDAWLISNLLPSVGSTFLGASDAATEGNWQWVTGESWGFSHWGSGQPDNYGSFQHYLITNHSATGVWDDTDGGYQTQDYVYAYLVEWDSDPSVPPPAAEPPDAPSNLAASVTVGNPIQLTWMDNSDDEEAFEVERRTEGTTFSRVAEFGPNSTVFEDTSTAPNTSYTYRVRAKNSAGASGYSNEDSVVSSAIAPAPKAPANLKVIEATTGLVKLQWSDASLDEVAFEVHRKVPGGSFSTVASLGSNSTSFTDSSLPPDTGFVYGVRSVNAFRASALVEVAASTLPTLSVTALRGDLKDSTKSLKDSIKVWAEFEFLPEASDGLFDPVVEGLSVRAGTVAAPVLMLVPPNMDGWKVAKGKATWKSPKGSAPKYKFEVFLETRLVKVTVTGLELAVPPTNPVRVSLGIGNDAGTDTGDWDASKPGVLKLR